jgi:hypothetical protein
MRTNENGYEHPTGVDESDGCRVEVGRYAVTATGPTLSATLRALAGHPLVQDGEVHFLSGHARGAVATIAGFLRERRAPMPTPAGRGTAACWQGHEVSLVDGRGRCHCGETISRLEPEVE